MSVEDVAPVVLDESLVAPIVLVELVLLLGDVELGVLAVELVLSGVELVVSVDDVREVSVDVDVLGDVELLELEVPEVELVPLGLEPEVELAVELLGSVVEVGSVDDVVFKLPLVFSFVVLLPVRGLVLELPYVEPVPLDGDVDEVPVP